jgi:hypothetical protein
LGVCPSYTALPRHTPLDWTRGGRHHEDQDHRCRAVAGRLLHDEPGSGAGRKRIARHAERAAHCRRSRGPARRAARLAQADHGAVADLTPDEATRFWPVYDRYQADLTRIKDDQYLLIAEYANGFGSYDDAKATDFITRWLDLDVRTTALRARYVPIIREVLPGVQATSFFQIDRRVSMLIDQRIASLLPVLQFQTQVAR